MALLVAIAVLIHTACIHLLRIQLFVVTRVVAFAAWTTLTSNSLTLVRLRRIVSGRCVAIVASSSPSTSLIIVFMPVALRIPNQVLVHMVLVLRMVIAPTWTPIFFLRPRVHLIASRIVLIETLTTRVALIKTTLVPVVVMFVVAGPTT